MKELIRHSGVIQSIEGNHIRVLIEQASACSGCRAKELCTASESKEKFIDLTVPLADRYTVGQEVVVCSSLTAGKLAVRLAFGYPMIIIIVWILFSIAYLRMNELLSVGILFVLLAAYFYILNRIRDRFDKVLSFWIDQP